MRLKYPEALPPRRSPSALCYLGAEDLHPRDPAAFEALWHGAERRYPAILEAIHLRSIHSNSELRESLLDFIALHIARSYTIWIMSQSILPDVLEKRVREAVNDPGLVLDYFQRTGLHVTGYEGRLALADALRQRMMERMESEPMVAEQFERQYGQAKNFVRGKPFEIIVSSGLDYLIGDIPVATLKETHPGVGPLGGVALYEADQVTMPLDRFHTMCLSKEDRIWNATDETVAFLNKVQVCGANERVMWHPEADHLDFVRQVVGQLASAPDEGR